MPTNINNEQTKSMYKITRLICFQFCLQISKYQEAKVSKKVHTDTGDDILPKKCCNTGPDRDAVDDDNEHPRKDAHCHHLQLRIRVGVINMFLFQEFQMYLSSCLAFFCRRTYSTKSIFSQTCHRTKG